MKDYNELAVECHANNAKWWHDLETGERLDRDKDELLMLVVSEIAEAMEAERKDLMDDKLPHRPGAEVELVDAVIRLADFAGGFGYDIKEGIYSEYVLPLPENKAAGLFDITGHVLDLGVLCSNYHAVETGLVSAQLFATLKRIEEYADKWGYDLDGAYVEKTAYNKTRKDHTHEARRAAGGKKF